MKKFLSVFCILSLVLCFSGCRTIDRMEDAVENKLDAAENAIEQSVNDTLLRPNHDTTELITPEQAQDIALEHAGVSSEETTGLYTVLDTDGRRQEYDVTFRVGHLEYEYEIDAETGNVLSFDKDN